MDKSKPGEKTMKGFSEQIDEMSPEKKVAVIFIMKAICEDCTWIIKKGEVKKE